MEKVRSLIDAGAPIPDAIKIALGMSLSAFALKHGRPRTVVARTINGWVRPAAADIAALQAELGGEEYEWRELLWEAGKPAPRVAAAR